MHGWALSEGGIEVFHKVRPGRAKGVERRLPLDVLDTRGGKHELFTTEYVPRLVDEVRPDDGYDLVMVPTKEYQAAQAIAEIKDSCPQAQFLLFTANWDGPEGIDALLDRDRYLWGYSACAGGYRGQTVVANLAPVVRLGEWGDQTTPRLERIIETFGWAGFGPDIKTDMIGWLWMHQGINSSMIGSGLYAGAMKTLASDRQWLDFMIRAVRESLAVVAARGVDPSSYPDTDVYLKESREKAVDALYTMLNETDWGRRAVEYGHFNQNREEMKHFFCQVYRSAKELKMETPLMDEINAGIEGC